MRPASKSIATILGVGLVLALAGEALADGRYRGRRRHSSRSWSRRSRGWRSHGRTFGGLSFRSRGYAGRTYGLSYYGRTRSYSGRASNFGRSAWRSTPRFHAAQRYGATRRHAPRRSYYRGSAGFAASIGPVRVIVVPTRSYGSSRYGYGRSRRYSTWRRRCR